MAAGALERLNSSINNSSTIVAVAGVDILGPAHKAVMYDSSGNVVIATSGDVAIGTVLSSSLDPIRAGREVHIAIKNIILMEAGDEIAIGDKITVNAQGQAETADSGSFIFGRAFEAATAAGQVIQVQINQMGFMP
ncbi:MAG: DUF2190 family protein [Defluviitaleaceae bacterium]|nr:DUF2190 family protein [Defluviitaleaceae bacterium]